MKDLKHLIYFESLLENANNELVQKAQAEGNLALGYTCYHVPEALLNVGNCFSVRLRAPNTGSIDIATYYMSNYTCEFARALVERGIEGGYQFLDAMIGVDACSMMNRAMEHFEILKVNEKPNFFVTHCDIPYKITDYTLDSYVKQMRIHVLDKLTEVYGVDTSDAAIRQAVAEHNEVCSIISEMAEMRKAENPVITGYEFHVINLVSMVCPKELILPYLRETAEELKTREPDMKWPFRCKVVLAGSENDDPDFTKLIESCGAEVVCDRYCYGAVESRIPIEIKEGDDPLYVIARHYLETSNCPRFMPQDEMRARKRRIAELAKEYHADGVIVASNKFCEYWSYERVIDTVVLPRDFGLPVCSIEKEYINSASGQLRTRFQAFVESVEIKKIQEGK
mgnify:CR=1 FL=1